MRRSQGALDVRLRPVEVLAQEPDRRHPEPADRVIETARAVDLVVMAQEKPVSEAGNRQVILERTIRKCGRPVLVLPFAGEFDSFGKTALLGWSPTREAAQPFCCADARSRSCFTSGSDGCRGLRPGL